MPKLAKTPLVTPNVTANVSIDLIFIIGIFLPLKITIGINRHDKVNSIPSSSMLKVINAIVAKVK